MLSRPMTFPPRHVALHLAAWLGMLVLAVLNGALREALLTPALGGTVGRQLSTLLLLALFAGWFWFLHRPGLWRPPGRRGSLGAVWLIMTLAFETFMGRVLGGKPWSAVFEDYDVLAGRIWILVPLWTLVGPCVRFQGSTERRRSSGRSGKSTVGYPRHQSRCSLHPSASGRRLRGPTEGKHHSSTSSCCGGQPPV